MPDSRKHRGRHPADTELFGERWLQPLRTATFEVSWLLERGYSERAAIDVVGDRHGLRSRQREAVRRAACPETAVRDRATRRRQPESIAGSRLAVDGFNVLITVEAALGGGLVTVGLDSVHRDLASVHGSYRRVEETALALGLLADALAPARAVTWFLDRPVSNSGRLAAMIRECADSRSLPWTVDVVFSPDAELVADREAVAVTSDGVILDRAAHWLDLPGVVIARSIPQVWSLDLRDTGAVAG